MIHKKNKNKTQNSFQICNIRRYTMKTTIFLFLSFFFKSFNYMNLLARPEWHPTRFRTGSSWVLWTANGSWFAKMGLRGRLFERETPMLGSTWMLGIFKGPQSGTNQRNIGIPSLGEAKETFNTLAFSEEHIFSWAKDILEMFYQFQWS